MLPSIPYCSESEPKSYPPEVVVSSASPTSVEFVESVESDSSSSEESVTVSSSVSVVLSLPA